MKKQIFSKMALMVALVAGLTACSNEDNIENTLSKQKVLINVTESQSFLATDGTPQTGGMTRALPAEHETGDEIKRGTIFEMNDAIGIFEVSNGQVTKANVPYYFNGEIWESSSSIDFNPSKTYYAYFPYKADLDYSSVVASAESADAFFAGVISAWPVATDQSSYDDYKASDLMVGNGTITVNNGIRMVNFQLAHQMGLVVLNLGLVKHILRSGTYYWFDVVTQKFKTGEEGNVTYYKPTNINDEWRAIVPLNTSATFRANDGQWTINAYATQKGHYQLYKIGCTENNPNAGVQYFDLKVGDIYYNDGSLLHVTDDNEEERMNRQSKAEGFVVFVSDGSAEDQKVIDPSLDENGMPANKYTHGLVMRIRATDINPDNNTDIFSDGRYIGSVTKTYKDNGNSPKTWRGLGAAAGDYDGIQSTTQVLGINGAYDTWYQTRRYGPAGTNVPNSGWFIPALGQLIQSLYRTGAIDPATYNSIIQSKESHGAGWNIDCLTKWEGYMTNAVKTTEYTDEVTFNQGKDKYALITSSYYPQNNTPNEVYYNWCVTFYSGQFYIFNKCSYGSYAKQLPRLVPMMLAF